MTRMNHVMAGGQDLESVKDITKSAAQAGEIVKALVHDKRHLD